MAVGAIYFLLKPTLANCASGGVLEGLAQSQSRCTFFDKRDYNPTVYQVTVLLIIAVPSGFMPGAHSGTSRCRMLGDSPSLTFAPLSVSGSSTRIPTRPVYGCAQHIVHSAHITQILTIPWTTVSIIEKYLA